MAFCSNCGKEVPPGGKFCGNCGKPAAGGSGGGGGRKCGQCGTTNGVKMIDGEPICNKCNSEMNAAIDLAMTNAQREFAKGGFLDKKFE